MRPKARRYAAVLQGARQARSLLASDRREGPLQQQHLVLGARQRHRAGAAGVHVVFHLAMRHGSEVPIDEVAQTPAHDGALRRRRRHRTKIPRIGRLVQWFVRCQVVAHTSRTPSSRLASRSLPRAS